jgi:glycosyltransferase involved in cell wall biosynthesis
MADWPFVSVVVPIFNGASTIDGLLRSLMDLSYPRNRYEIIVVDNASQDGTPRHVQQYPVQLLYERQIQSSYAARNRGVEAAKGEIIAFTDAACVAHPDWLSCLLADHKDLRWGGFAGGFQSYQPITDVQRHMTETGAHCLAPGFEQQPFLAPQSRGELLCSRFGFLDYRAGIRLPSNLVNAPTGNVAYRREIFDEIGHFDVRLTSCGDLDFAWRVQTQTNWQIEMVPAALIYYQYRRDLSGMARQFRKNGWGYGLLALKYGAHPHQIACQMGIESVLLIGLAIASHSWKTVVRLLRSMSRGSDRGLYLKEPVFTMVRSVNFYYGRWVAARKGNQWLSLGR